MLDGVSVEVRVGQVTALFGKSGSGKSTLLRIAAGLIAPQSGSVLLNGASVTRGSGRIGMMFQGYALFDWYTAAENITVARAMAGLSKDAEAAQNLLNFVGLAERGDTYPRSLSGGMRQRLALARALATEPDYLLLDEPFAALDLQTKNLIAEFTFQRLRTKGVGVLVVAHEPEAVVPFADHVCVLTGAPATEIVDISESGVSFENIPGSLTSLTRQIRAML